MRNWVYNMLMGKSVSVRQHLQQVWEIVRWQILYLLSLDFVLLLQIILFGGGLLLLYFGNAPWPLTLVLGLMCVSFFNIALTGVSKNLMGLARGRGTGKYPVFHFSYLRLGLPALLIYLLINVVPLMIVIAFIFVLLNGTFPHWPLVLAGTAVFFIIWQWFFGLTVPILLDRRVAIAHAMQSSALVVKKHWWLTLKILLVDISVFIVIGLIPVIGIFAALNWISLSSFSLYWQWQTEIS